MFEESLVIILLLVIFFVVFYIIYNNSCGCNKSLIEKFEVDTTNPIFSNAIEQINDINRNISRIDGTLNETNQKILSLSENMNNNPSFSQELEEIKRKIRNNIDAKTLDDILLVIKEFNDLKDRFPNFFIELPTIPDNEDKKNR
jgi:peptidoglycan hydrolase CwlO-like protein